MSLIKTWKDVAGAVPEHERQAFWKSYFALEKGVYEQILSSDEPITGTLGALGERFGMEPFQFAGFMDGVNTSLSGGEVDLEALTEESEVSLAVDLEKLYFNMHAAKADWLYTLPQWEDVLGAEARKEIAKRYREQNIYIAPKKVGRNDPCPCGSGRKYKVCCGK